MTLDAKSKSLAT